MLLYGQMGELTLKFMGIPLKSQTRKKEDKSKEGVDFPSFFLYYIKRI
jgi:hypothetical protein